MKKHLLIIRFSALGDVMMTVPVIDSLARCYPDLKITFVSRRELAPIFALLPSNVSFLGLDYTREIHGRSVFEIFRKVSSVKPDVVCDLHNMLRTRALDLLFRLSGVKVYVLDKNRLEKWLYLRKRPVVQRKRMFQAYADTLAKAGFPVEIKPDERYSLLEEPEHREGIGVAPFAKHKGKMLSPEKREELVAMLCSTDKVFLFGSKGRESVELQRLADKYTNVVNMAGALPDLAAELRFISTLKLMYSTDSANMHLASLCGTRVVSFWGATHPMAGFLGWGQSLSDCVQVEMTCRPCSFYGKKPCRKGDYSCMKLIKILSL